MGSGAPKFCIHNGWQCSRTWDHLSTRLVPPFFIQTDDRLTFLHALREYKSFTGRGHTENALDTRVMEARAATRDLDPVGVDKFCAPGEIEDGRIISTVVFPVWFAVVPSYKNRKLLPAKILGTVTVMATDLSFFTLLTLAHATVWARVSYSVFLAHVLEDAEYDEKVDIWAIGVICYIMMTGRKPFEGTDIEEIDALIALKRITDQYNDLIKPNACS